MILIVGCSFSMGWYKFIGDKEVVQRDYCWYDELDRPYRVYAHPSGGMMSFCKCLDLVCNPAPASTSAILIQESFGPRIVIPEVFQYKQWRENVHSWDLDYYLFSNTIAGLPNKQKILSEKFDFDWQPGISKWMSTLSSNSNGWDYLNTACTSHLDHIAEAIGLPTYAYSFTGIKYPYKYIKYLDVPPATETLFWNSKYHHYDEHGPLHFNRDGNRKLGQMIKKGLDNELS